MMSDLGGLKHSWSKKARKWGVDDTEEVLLVTLSEALHSYRDYLLDLAGGTKMSDGKVAEPDASLEIFLRLSASAADGLRPSRRELLRDAKLPCTEVLGLDFASAVFPGRCAGRSPWLQPQAYRLARAAISFQMSLAGDPDDYEYPLLEHRSCGLHDSIFAALLRALDDAEKRVLDAAVTASDASCPGSGPRTSP